MWDSDGNRYIDFHAAFSPMLLGHNDPEVNAAVRDSLDAKSSLFGAGTTRDEGILAELIVDAVSSVEQVQLTNSGSEATFHAIRIARAATGRDGVIVMQGGYNGWHNDVAYNLMDPVTAENTWQPGEELERRPFTAGIPKALMPNTHPVQFNDLGAVESLIASSEIASVILEPVLQNIGVVPPTPGYLEGLRRICDKTGTVLIFDEVKTGFRNGLGGYQGVADVAPDLTTFGKAVANGYPLGVIGGKESLMSHFHHSDPSKRVLIAGTYNGHFIPVSAAIATLSKLRAEGDEIYGRLESLGQRMEIGLGEAIKAADIPGVVARIGSALCPYFMSYAPMNWYDIATDHNAALDRLVRSLVLEAGIYHFPIPAKQISISAAHTAADIDEAVDRTAEALLSNPAVELLTS